MQREYAEQLEKFSRFWVRSPQLSDFQVSHSNRILEAVSRFSGVGQIFLAGYPRHTNLGDQAIWHAHRMIFKRAGLSVKGLITTYRDIEFLRVHDHSSTTVIFTGGGSLGDRYRSAAWRLSVMRATKKTKFVQLPASTTFAAEPTKMTEDLASLYAQHDRMLVMCRDAKSLHEAQHRLGVQGLLTPDLVHLFPDVSHLKRGGRGALHLLRSDQEIDRASVEQRPENVNDWDDIPAASERQQRMPRLLGKASHVLDTVALSRLSQRFGLRGADSLARFHTSRALAYLSLFDSIVTDRLHGVILSERLGLPTHVIDNDHGKISRYLASWGADLRNFRFHKNLGDAIAAASKVM